MEADLGSYSDDPDTFQHIALVYDLTWKDTMIILGQFLADTEQKRVLWEARRCANSLHLSDPKYPIEEIVVPPIDPGWDYNSSAIWEREYFVIYLKAELKAGWQKLISYMKVTAITQGPEENTTAFLERLWEALIKHANLDISSYEGQVIMKDKFLTHFALDIRWKLQEIIQEPGTTLVEMLSTATNVFYKHDQVLEARAHEKEHRKDFRHDQMLVAFHGQFQSMSMSGPAPNRELIEVQHLLTTWPLGQKLSQQGQASQICLL